MGTDVSSNGHEHLNVVDGDDIVTDVNFGNLPVPGDVSGVKWNDLDGDGVRDPNEPGCRVFTFTPTSIAMGRWPWGTDVGDGREWLL